MNNDSCTAYSEGDEHGELHLKPSLGIEGNHCVWFSSTELEEEETDTNTEFEIFKQILNMVHIVFVNQVHIKLWKILFFFF